MARDTHPTLIAYQEIAYTGTGTRSFTGISWQTGDVVAVTAGSEGSASGKNVGPPANQTGLAFAGTAHTSGSNCAGGVWTAVATSGGSAAISVTDAQETWGASLFQWRGNTDGVGQRFVTASPSATRTINVTPTDTHSGFVWGVYDWNTNSYTNGTFAPAPVTDTRQLGLNGGGGGYMISVADLTDRASAAQTGFGLGTAAPSSGVFTIVGAEILGTTSGGAAVPPDLIMLPPDSY